MLLQKFIIVLTSLSRLIMTGCHSVCIGGVYPSSQVRRFDIPKDKIPWSVEFPEYDPPFFESKVLIGKPWADSQIGNGVFKWNSQDGLVNRESFEGTYSIDNGCPLNPVGRTGIKGRGLLGRYGPNHAADPIVTRWKRDKNGTVMNNSDTKKPILQLVVIKRRDNGMWALPGGMVDSKELVYSAAVREFLEEATNSLQKTTEENNALKLSIEELFSSGKEVYRGYVDDPRNTDNAWMETTAFNFHDDSGNTIGHVQLTAGDDAANVNWIDIDKNVSLYASHSTFISKVVNIKDCHW